MAKIRDKYSLEWQVVSDFCMARIEELHLENEVDLNSSDTNSIRGKIQFAREVLALAETETVYDIPNNQYIE